MEEYTQGYSYWGNDVERGLTTIPPPITMNIRRMPRYYMGIYDVRPLFTVVDSVIQNLTIYLRFLEEKMTGTETPKNSVTEQAALDELRVYLEARIEKTKALLELIR